MRSTSSRALSSTSRASGGEVVGAQAHVDLGAHRGERRAQLVGGVGDQPVLLLDAVLEAVEHRVERAARWRDLVAAARDRDALVEAVDADRVGRRASCARPGAAPGAPATSRRAAVASSAAGPANRSRTSTRCTERRPVASDSRDDDHARGPSRVDRAGRDAGSAASPRRASGRYRGAAGQRGRAARRHGAASAPARPGRRRSTATRSVGRRAPAPRRARRQHRARDVAELGACPRARSPSAIWSARRPQRRGRSAPVRSARSRSDDERAERDDDRAEQHDVPRRHAGRGSAAFTPAPARSRRRAPCGSAAGRTAARACAAGSRRRRRRCSSSPS